jgi:hypothetical protein
MVDYKTEENEHQETIACMAEIDSDGNTLTEQRTGGYTQIGRIL